MIACQQHRLHQSVSFSHPCSQICCAKFNLKDSNLIGAGQYNGQFTVYDMRKGTSPVDTTPIDISHRDPVYDIAWLQVKGG